MSKYNLPTWFLQKFFWNHELKQVFQMLTEISCSVYYRFFKSVNWHKQAVKHAMPEKKVIN